MNSSYNSRFRATKKISIPLFFRIFEISFPQNKETAVQSSKR